MGAGLSRWFPDDSGHHPTRCSEIKGQTNYATDKISSKINHVISYTVLTTQLCVQPASRLWPLMVSCPFSSLQVLRASLTALVNNSDCPATLKVRARTNLLEVSTMSITESLRSIVLSLCQDVQYPSKSLNFLQNCTVFKDVPKGDDNAAADLPTSNPVSLNILVIGAGLGGLTVAVALAVRGHRVTVLEQAPYLTEVGADIQIPPNSSRILHDLGLAPYLVETAVEPESMTFHRWENGAPIARTKLVPDFRQRFHAPYYVIHRADFHQALYKRAIELGITLKLNQKVTSYNPDAPSVTLENGTIVEADLIVAADGM